MEKTKEQLDFEDWKEKNQCYYPSCRYWVGDLCECTSQKVWKALELQGLAIKSINKQNDEQN